MDKLFAENLSKNSVSVDASTIFRLVDTSTNFFIVKIFLRFNIWFVNCSLSTDLYAVFPRVRIVKMVPHLCKAEEGKLFAWVHLRVQPRRYVWRLQPRRFVWRLRNAFTRENAKLKTRCLCLPTCTYVDETKYSIQHATFRRWCCLEPWP